MAVNEPRTENHLCFGCQRQIQSGELHIHVGLDEWSEQKGLPGGFGLDDLLTFPFCEQCIEKSERGWTPEQHEIERAVSR